MEKFFKKDENDSFQFPQVQIDFGIIPMAELKQS